MNTLARKVLVVPLVGVLLVLGVLVILPRLAWQTETPDDGKKPPTPAVTSTERSRTVLAEATATRHMGVTLIKTSSVHGGPETLVNVERYVYTFRYDITLLRGETVKLELIVVPLRAGQERFSTSCWFTDWGGKKINRRDVVIPAGPAKLEPLVCRYTTTG